MVKKYAYTYILTMTAPFWTEGGRLSPQVDCGQQRLTAYIQLQADRSVHRSCTILYYEWLLNNGGTKEMSGVGGGQLGGKGYNIKVAEHPAS